MVALPLQPVESRGVAGRDLALLGRVEPQPPAPTVGGVGGHLALEELSHRRLVRDTQEVEQIGVGALPVAPDDLVEADEVKALPVVGRQPSHALLSLPEPIRPEVDPGCRVGWMVCLLAQLDLGDARVTPVAHAVDEPRLGEDPRQLRRGRDREGAHLDQRRLAGLVGKRPQQVVEERSRTPGPRHRSSLPRTSRPLPRSGREQLFCGGRAPSAAPHHPPGAGASAGGWRRRARDRPPPPAPGPASRPEPGTTNRSAAWPGTPRSWPARRPRRRGPSGCSESGTRSAPRKSGSGGRADATTRSSRCGRCPL